MPSVRNISLHMPFKMCVLLRGKPAVSPMSGASTFDIEKKQKRDEFKGGVLHMIIFLRYCRSCFDEASHEKHGLCYYYESFLCAGIEKNKIIILMALVFVFSPLLRTF